MAGNNNVHKTIWKKENKEYNPSAYAAFLGYILKVLKVQ